MKSSKYFLIVGGFMAFTLTFLVSFFSNNSTSTSLLRASAGCIAGVILMKFFLKSLLYNIHMARLKSEAAEEEKETAPATPQKESEPTPK